jgi:hypothetical protein
LGRSKNSLNKIEKWSNVWRIKLNTEKTKVVVFSRCPQHASTAPDLFLARIKLKVHESAEFLGVTFDSKLT